MVKGKSTIRQKKRGREGKQPSEARRQSNKSLSNKAENENSAKGNSNSKDDKVVVSPLLDTKGEEEENEVEDSLAEEESEEEEDDDEEEKEEGEEDGEQEEEDDDFPLKKKSKKSKHDDGSNDFSSAVNAILSSHLKAYDRNDPIMARNKKVLKQNESDKLEKKAKKALLVERKKMLEKARNKEIIPRITEDGQSGEEIRTVLEKETKLRKIARKGAVKLFNAILSTQVKTERDANDKFGDIRNKQEREQLITEVSKERFLDMVKAAGDED